MNGVEIKKHFDGHLLLFLSSSTSFSIGHPFEILFASSFSSGEPNLTDSSVEMESLDNSAEFESAFLSRM